MARNSTTVTEEQAQQKMSNDELLTIREVAHRLRVDGTTVRRWITLGLLDAVTLPHINKRRVYRVRKQTLDRILEEGFPSTGDIEATGDDEDDE